MLTNKRFYPWLIWALGAAFFFSEYFARVAPSVMVPELMRSFHVGALSLGALSAFFYYAYVSMQMPVGALVDRFGPHKLLTVTALLSAVGCFVFTLAHNLYVAELGRFILGFGAAFAFVGTLKLAKIWFGASKFGYLAGLTQALGMLGAAVGEGPLSVSVHHIGWRQTMWIIGGVLFVIALLIAIFVRDKPEKDPSLSISTREMFKGLGVVLRNQQTWLNGLFVGLLYAPTAAFAELWGTSYIKTVHHLHPEIAATGISFIFIGWAIGGPIMGLISDRIGRRKPCMLFSAVMSLVVMAAILYSSHMTEILLFALLFCFGLANTGVGVSYALASEINPAPIAGTSMAFANMASVLVGAMFQPIIGWFLDLGWRGQMSDGVKVFSVADFHHAMLALLLCLLMSVVVLFFVKETYCRNV